MVSTRFTKQLSIAAAASAALLVGSAEMGRAFNVSEVVDAPDLVQNASFTAAALGWNAGTTSVGANTIAGRSASFLDPADLFRFVLGQNNAAVSFSVARTGGTVTSAVAPTLALYQRTVGSLLGLPVTTGSTLLNSGSAFSFASLPSGEYFLQVLRPGTSGANLVRSINYTATINVTPAPVPEPFTMLGGAAALGVGGMMQRKRKQKKLAVQKAD